MEPVTAAIIAALTAGAASGVTEADKKAISDGYSRLKDLINKKFGGNVTDAIEKLQAKPESAGRRQTLAEELKATNASADPELLGAAQSLLKLIKALPQGDQHIQNAVGAGIAQADREEFEEWGKQWFSKAKEKLEEWGKRKFWIVLGVFALVGLFGATAIAQLVLQGNIEMFQNRLWDNSQRQFDASDRRESALNDRLITAGNKAEAASQRSSEILEQVRTLQSNVSAALLQLQKLRTDVTAVQNDFEKAVADSPVLLPDERAFIRIKVVPLRTDSQNSSGRVLTRLTYSVDVPDKDSQHFLNSIERVMYVLNPRWFTNNEIERRDPENRFSFSIDVWGVTDVRVHVYLRKGGDPIDFEGPMNLNEISYLTAKHP